MCWIRVLCCFLIISPLAILEQVEAQSALQETDLAKAKAKRILFAGSSSVYWNDLPNSIAKVITSTGGIQGTAIHAEMVGRSGSDIRVYLDPECKYEYGAKRGQTFLDKVRDEAFDYVVLMAVCRFIMGDGEGNEDGNAHAVAITQYCNAIRASGAEPVIYEMVWGAGERESQGRLRILELAQQNQIKLYVPCSTAWDRVRRERPELALQHPNDNSHPGDLGHFLNVACFYAVLRNETPLHQLPRKFPVWPHLTKSEKDAKKTELDEALKSFRPDEHQSKLPEWMRRNAAAGYEGEIAEQDALYLEQVAWEEWNKVKAKITNP